MYICIPTRAPATLSSSSRLSYMCTWGGAEEKRLGTTVLKHKQTIHAYNNRLRRLLNVQYHLKIFEKCAVGENGLMGQNIFF